MGRWCGWRAIRAGEALAMRVRRDVHFEADRRIVEQNSPAAFAEHHLFAVTQILEELRAQQDLAA